MWPKEITLSGFLTKHPLRRIVLRSFSDHWSLEKGLEPTKVEVEKFQFHFAKPRQKFRQRPEISFNECTKKLEQFTKKYCLDCKTV